MKSKDLTIFIHYLSGPVLETNLIFKPRVVIISVDMKLLTGGF